MKVYLNDPIAESAVARLRAHVELVDNFDHPEELEVPPETVRFDPRCEYHVPKVKKAEAPAAGVEKSA